MISLILVYWNCTKVTLWDTLKVKLINNDKKKDIEWILYSYLFGHYDWLWSIGHWLGREKIKIAYSCDCVKWIFTIQNNVDDLLAQNLQKILKQLNKMFGKLTSFEILPKREQQESLWRRPMNWGLTRVIFIFIL